MSPVNLVSVGDDVLACCFECLFTHVPHNAVAERVRLVCHAFDDAVRHRAPRSWARLLGPSRLADVTHRNVSELQLRLRRNDVRLLPSGWRAPPALTRLALIVPTEAVSWLVSWLVGNGAPTGLVALHLYLTGHTRPAVDDLARLLCPVAAQLDDLVVARDRWSVGHHSDDGHVEPWLLAPPERRR